jgi:transcriptional regulator with XRE-family HTH domain
MWLAIAGQPLLRAAERVGCSAGMLTHWLYGDRRPTAEWLTKIEDAYGIAAGEWGRLPSEAFQLPAVEQAAEESESPDDSGAHAAVHADKAG